MRKWWDRERRIRDLTIRLNAKAEELHGVHRSLALLRARATLAERNAARLAVRVAELEQKLEGHPS